MANSYTNGPETWIAFAQEDLKAVECLMPDGPWGMACFHCQQGVEKVLKAFLRKFENRTIKTHSLAELLENCGSYDRSFLKWKRNCLLLDRFYIPTRYPDAPVGALPEGLPDVEDAQKACADFKKIFRFVTSKLGGAR